MFKDTPDGTTHSYNDGCGIKEHNMTLREKTYHEIERVLTNFKNGQTYSNSIEQIQDIFLAQFDAMLAEDIEKMSKLFESSNSQTTVDGRIGFREGIAKATSILEARRLELKK